MKAHTMAIPQRALGQSDLIVGAQGLGCMSMREFYGGSATDDRESIATIQRASELGVTLLDTSDMYARGENEKLIGRAIEGRRDAVVLASKFGIVRKGDDPLQRSISGRPEYVQSACEASLARLGVDHIDLYYQHRVDPDVPIEETVGAMSALVSQGKVRYLGLCEPSPRTIRRAAAVHPIAAVQSEWSLFARDIEQEVAPTCRDLGIGIVAYSPLGRGLLTGSIREATDMATDDIRRRDQPRFQAENLQRNVESVRKLEQLAHGLNCTAAQLALAWVHAQGDDVVPIPGSKQRRHLDQNVEALGISLTAEHSRELDAIRAVGDRYGNMESVRGETVELGSG
jgi:aryl-alcohol dehydrogenase-like predicted oxidoreductase